MPVCLVTSFVGLFNKHLDGLGIANPLVVGHNKHAGEIIVIIGGLHHLVNSVCFRLAYLFLNV